MIFWLATVLLLMYLITGESFDFRPRFGNVRLRHKSWSATSSEFLAVNNFCLVQRLDPIISSTLYTPNSESIERKVGRIISVAMNTVGLQVGSIVVLQVCIYILTLLGFP
jgi:hypothetical protein